VNNPRTLAGYAPHEMLTAEPTRSAKLKWVVIVDEAMPAGRIVNATACVAAVTGSSVPGLLGADAKDAAGNLYPGLPWAGCTILAASQEKLASIKARADASEDLVVASMPDLAQHTRVYDDYLRAVSAAGPSDLRYCALSIIGPRGAVDKITRKLPLLP
jgi:hypothetical protein